CGTRAGTPRASRWPCGLPRPLARRRGGCVEARSRTARRDPRGLPESTGPRSSSPLPEPLLQVSEHLFRRHVLSGTAATLARSEPPLDERPLLVAPVDRLTHRGFKKRRQSLAWLERLLGRSPQLGLYPERGKGRSASHLQRIL